MLLVKGGLILTSTNFRKNDRSFNRRIIKLFFFSRYIILSANLAKYYPLQKWVHIIRRFLCVRMNFESQWYFFCFKLAEFTDCRTLLSLRKYLIIFYLPTNRAYSIVATQQTLRICSNKIKHHTMYLTIQEIKRSYVDVVMTSSNCGSISNQR